MVVAVPEEATEIHPPEAQVELTLAMVVTATRIVWEPVVAEVRRWVAQSSFVVPTEQGSFS